MADVFVSYVSEDRVIAEKISRGLEEAGLSVWWDRHIQGGVDFGSEIERQLDVAKTVVVLWSATSRVSKWVRDEAQQARDENKLIPVRLDEAQPPLGFRQTHAIDFAGWNGDPRAGIFDGLVASVQRLVGGAPSGPVAEDAPSYEPSRGRWRVSKRWLIAGIAAFVAAAAALWVFGPDLGPRQATGGNDGSVEIGAFKISTKSDELERFADGVAGAIVRVFATNGIKTTARADAGSGVASNAPTEFELRGRVDRDGDDLVASADFANRRDGVVLWSTTTKRDAGQLQILQEQFAASIADVLRCGFHLRERSNGVASTDVFALYLRLCEAFNNYDYQGEQTPELTRRIVEAAPQDAASYHLQAVANALVSTTPTSNGASRPPAEIARLRKIVYDSAQAAIAIDPKSDPYYARAIVVDPAVGAAEREKLLQKSIEQEPGGGGPLYAYATLLTNVGRIHEARINLERALNVNPLDKRYLAVSAFLAGWLGNIEVARHEYDELLGKQILTKEQVDFGRFWSEFFFGDPAIAKAINEGDKVMSDSCMKGVVDALVAQTRLSEDELMAICPGGWDVPYGYFGHIDKAFLLAEANRTAQNNPLSDGNRDLFLPRMNLVRADPRFMPLAARLGLVDYWLDTDQWPDFCATEQLPYDCKEAALAARAAATK